MCNLQSASLPVSTAQCFAAAVALMFCTAWYHTLAVSCPMVLMLNCRQSLACTVADAYTKATGNSSLAAMSTAQQAADAHGATQPLS
jgi:hypothetical protein